MGNRITAGETQFQYDERGTRIRATTAIEGGSTIDLTYSYDSAGRLSEVKEENRFNGEQLLSVKMNLFEYTEKGVTVISYNENYREGAVSFVSEMYRDYEITPPAAPGGGAQLSVVGDDYNLYIWTAEEGGTPQLREH